MVTTSSVQHLVCNCTLTWSGILPPPPCEIHRPQAHNGLCQCRGPLDPHPFHHDSYMGQFWPVEKEYEGKHRRD